MSDDHAIPTQHTFRVVIVIHTTDEDRASAKMCGIKRPNPMLHIGTLRLKELKVNDDIYYVNRGACVAYSKKRLDELFASGYLKRVE